MSTLAGKRILVTGAGSGIGRATARLCASRGAKLVLVGRQAATLVDTLPDARHVVCDQTDDAAVAALAAGCLPLDGLVLNAGQFEPGTLVDGDPMALTRMLDANVRGPWLVCRHLAPRLRDGGSVVLVGSNLGIRAIAGAAAYSVAKAALHHLARVLAVEWAPRRIRCNAIAPGPVDTPMLRGRLAADDDLDARFGGVNPLRRVGRDAEVAALAAYLLADESGWTTGTVIPCDGGATAAF